MKGLALLNATPFWTVFNSRSRAASGTVPLPQFISDAINRRIFARIAAPSNVRRLLSQVYIHGGAVDDELVARICAAARHPHAVDAFVSMMTAPRGAKEMSAMVADVCARGVPVCLIHGAPAASVALGLHLCPARTIAITSVHKSLQ